MSFVEFSFFSFASEKISSDKMVRLREILRPKQLKPSSEFPGYS